MTTLTRGPALRTPMNRTSGPPGTQDRKNIIARNRPAEQVHSTHFCAYFVLGLLCGFARLPGTRPTAITDTAGQGKKRSIRRHNGTSQSKIRN